jgi:hypothetical protein
MSVLVILLRLCVGVFLIGVGESGGERRVALLGKD